MTVDNDTRGWILTSISAVACVLGASVICVDLIVQRFPKHRNFRIQDSNDFLTCSLSLSAGVMLFSALYKMLGSSQSSLENGGYTSNQAAWILIACFLAGVWGIQILSRIMHHFMPSHVVDCDHTHDEPESQKLERGRSVCDADDHGHEDHLHTNGAAHNDNRAPELQPLLQRNDSVEREATWYTARNSISRDDTTDLEGGGPNRPSLPARMTMKVTELVARAKTVCDREGPCHGYSNPCGADCFRNLNTRGRLGTSTTFYTRPNFRSVSTGFKDRQNTETAHDEEFRIDYEERGRHPSQCSAPANPKQASEATYKLSRALSPGRSSFSSSSPAPLVPQDAELQHSTTVPHHHHVPQNAFLSLSLQTSMAIALHKLPEGFITYATNHANPDLGFTVFLALAIHNVTEGFALALPLYLATNSRVRAMLYSILLGGFSQPLGAGIAALWLALAETGKGDFAPGEAVYGGMFAATAGIMASVALNLLQQSFELSHSKGLCMFFVFVGMGILGVSSALTA